MMTPPSVLLLCILHPLHSHSPAAITHPVTAYPIHELPHETHARCLSQSGVSWESSVDTKRCLPAAVGTSTACSLRQMLIWPGFFFCPPFVDVTPFYLIKRHKNVLKCKSLGKILWKKVFKHESFLNSWLPKESDDVYFKSVLIKNSLDFLKDFQVVVFF